MTDDEMTTGSLSASEVERKWYAARSRWWNSTGGGSASNPVKGNNATMRGIGAVKAGDGGVKFRAEWAELDAHNWEWMKKNNIDPATGQVVQNTEDSGVICSPEVAALRRGPTGSTAGLGDAGRAARDVGQSWLWRNKYLVAFMAMVTWVTLQRLLPDAGD